MVKIEQSGTYAKRLEELCQVDPDIIEVVKRSVKLFRRNPNDTRLDSHPLHKKMEGKWAFSVTEDIRIVYEWLSDTTARFLTIGAHATVYQKQLP